MSEENRKHTIKSCPFCEVSQVDAYYHENVEMEEQYRVGCGACASHSPVFKTPEEAIVFWNVRVEKRKPGHCPRCNSHVEMREYKINPEGRTYYNYLCECGFESGHSHDKELIERNWLKIKNT